MRIISIVAGIVWCGAAWISGGCRTAEGPNIPVPEPGGQALQISREGEARAEALAYYSVGRFYEYNDEFDAAFSNYQEAVRRDPDSEELVLRLTSSLLQQKRNQEAIDTIQALVKRNPQSQKALIWLALIYRATGQQDKVEETYAQLIRKFPKETAGYVELAALYSSQGRDEEAINLLEKAAKQVREPLDVLRALGSIYLQRSLIQGKAADEKKNRLSAIRIFERLGREYPDDIAVQYQLGDLYILDQQLEKAIECFEKIEAKYPNNLQIKQKLALSFVASGNKEKAIEQLEEIASKRPDNSRVFYYLGELYEETGQTNKAVMNYEFAAKAGQNEPAPYLKLALLKLQANPDEAISILKDGLTQMPDNPRLTEMLAYVYLSQKKYALAEEHFARALKLFKLKETTPISPSLYFNYAIAAQKAGHTNETSDLLTKSLEISPNVLEAYVQYNLRQPSENDQKIAIGILEKMVEQTPNQAHLYIHLGALNSGLKNYAKAVEAFEKAEPLMDDLEDKNVELLSFYYFWYGAACERQGLFDRAVKCFEKSIELDENNPEAYNYLAYMWAEKGIQLDKALDYIHKALAIEPNSGAFLDTLGWIYYMQGQYEKALTEIKKALEIIPDDATIAEHLGDVYSKLNKKDEALANWKKAFISDPENQKLAEKLKAQGVDLEPLRKEAIQKQKQKKESSEELLEPPMSELPIPLQEDDELPGMDDPENSLP
jgi:tetratricopeptide (TPR) repeat protein